MDLDRKVDVNKLVTLLLAMWGKLSDEEKADLRSMLKEIAVEVKAQNS